MRNTRKLKPLCLQYWKLETVASKIIPLKSVYQPGNLYTKSVYQPGNLYLKSVYQPGNLYTKSVYQPANLYMT